MRFTDKDGGEWELDGKIVASGDGKLALVGWGWDPSLQMSIPVHPVPKEHTFGSPIAVVYEETGEKRKLQDNEYGMGGDGNLIYWNLGVGASYTEFTVLRPVRIER